MGYTIFEYCGMFAWPQLAVSIATLGVWLGYLFAYLRNERTGLEAQPWQVTLEPLGSVAMQVGLLGSVVGFITAFGGFHNGIDVERLTRGLAKAYWTTGVGLVTALMSALGVYSLNVLYRGRGTRVE